MHPRRRVALIASLSVLAAMGPGSAGPAVARPNVGTTGPSAACGPTWRTVASPNGGGSSSELRAAAGTSASDIWAVGDSGTKALIEHYDGTKWRIVPSPGSATALNGVVAISPRNAWAVGYVDGHDIELPATGKGLVEHWNGHSWKVVGLPAVVSSASSGTVLSGISVVTAKDIWVVGEHDGSHLGPLALHYDGSHWTVFDVDTSLLGQGRLLGVTAVGASDVWAVGDIFQGDTIRLTAHWDGHAWTSIAAATPTTDGQLRAVDSVSSNDVYAAGNSINEFLPTAEVQRVRSHHWSPVTTPAQPSVSELDAVVAVSKTSIWAAGWFATSSGASDAGLVLHSSGGAFTRTAAPAPGLGKGLALVAGKQLWLVGSTITGKPPNEGSKTFIARRCV